MSYTITLPNGSLLTTILDGTVDNTSSSLTLVGRNYSGYGQIIAEDLVALLVNFSDNTSPNNPNQGQLWYDSANNLMKVYTGSSWKNIGSVTSQTGAPTTTVPGDMWWDSVNKQLYIYDGTNPFSASGWILVGPGYSVINGKSGALWEQITDGILSHDVVSLYLDGSRYAVISSSNFSPNVSVPGFATIQQGVNINSNYPLSGTANNANYLGGYIASNYFRTDLNNVGSGSLSLTSNAGVILGSLGNFTANIHSTTGTGQLWNTKVGANISLHVATSGGDVKALAANGADGLIYVNGDPTSSLGVATKNYVDNKFVNADLTNGIAIATTAPAGTSNTWIATTAFVSSGLSGLYPYKIYQGNTWFWINDTGVGSANLSIDGSTVLTATASGVVLSNGATATTQGQTYNTTGNGLVATTQFVKTATTWWNGSAKFVSNSAPNPGVNDIGSNNGDFWFQLAS